MKAKKQRLDLLLLSRFPSHSRHYLANLIMQGKVRVEGEVITKAGTLVDLQAQCCLDIPEISYVSRAGYKLAHALKYFEIEVKGKVVLDAGISTGGFTDCLLQAGAAKIYGVDVGQGLVHEKIKTDPRLILIENTNVRHLTFQHIPEPLDLITLDLSFISITKVISTLLPFMKEKIESVFLIKPQFEAGKHHIARGGVARKESHPQVIENVQKTMALLGFRCVGIISSPLKGATSGNTEYLGYFVKEKKI